MTRDLQQRQEASAAAIPLFRYNPARRPFDLAGFEPKTITVASDLPPYLVLGQLDESSFQVSAAGWSAVWRGNEVDTLLQLDYLAAMDHYRIQQKWCGVDGAYSMAWARTPLGKAIAQVAYMQFPPSWDRAAQEHLERTLQVRYVPPLKNAASYFGMPDGAFRTIAIPLAVQDLQRVRECLDAIAATASVAYPIVADAKLVLQVINYVEGRAPDWTGAAQTLLDQSIRDTGTVPQGMPVRESAPDGSATWTLRRFVNVLFITVPFAGLADLAKRLSFWDGPVRGVGDPSLRLELRPLVLPLAFELQSQSISMWDADRTTRSTLHVGDPCRLQAGPMDAGIVDRQSNADDVAGVASESQVAQPLPGPRPQDEAVPCTPPQQPPVAVPVKRTKSRKRQPAPDVTPLQELEAMDVKARIQAIADDLPRRPRTRRFADIDDWTIAELLGVDLNTAPEVHRAMARVSLDDFSDDFPALEHLELLNGEASPQRYRQLEVQGEQIRAGLRTKDLALKPAERRAMEEAITLERINDGAGWLILRCSLDAQGGGTVCFQVLQGDAGELSDLTGPYLIHDKGWPEPEDWVLD